MVVKQQLYVLGIATDGYYPSPDQNDYCNVRADILNQHYGLDMWEECAGGCCCMNCNKSSRAAQPSDTSTMSKGSFPFVTVLTLEHSPAAVKIIE